MRFRMVNATCAKERKEGEKEVGVKVYGRRISGYEYEEKEKRKRLRRRKSGTG